MTVTENDEKTYRQLILWDYLPRDTAEREKKEEVYESQRITETEITNRTKQAEGLLEQILDPHNLNLAYKQVKKNKGAGGMDGMQVDELLPYLIEHQVELRQSIQDGKYRPSPVRRVEIPKENGKTRKLGIPTVVDRMIQQAICQILSPIYERKFSENSYGFRPKRGAHDALRQCQTNITDGYRYVVDFGKVF